MLVRVCAFVIWALVAGTVVFWGLRLMVRAPQAPAHVVAVSSDVAVRADLSRLFGAAPVATAAAGPAAPEASSRFRLLGVMAAKADRRADATGQGVALIAVDGKPARAYAVGARLDTDLVLQSVSLRTASIGPAQGAASVKLEIPPLPAPATGTLPNSALSAGAAGAAPSFTPPVAPMMAPPIAPPAPPPTLPTPASQPALINPPAPPPPPVVLPAA
jgi:general secretion pathway protein C